MKALQRIIAPTAQPVTLAEIKMSGRISTTAHDTMLNSLIVAAVEAVEEYCNRALITQTWKITRDDIDDEDDGILPRPPLQSVTSIKYIDTNGDQQTVDSSIYQVDTASEPGEIMLLPGQMWPAIGCGYKNQVEITFVAGYGSTAASVPEKIRQSIIALVVHWYDKGIGEEIPKGIKRALDNYRLAYEL